MSAEDTINFLRRYNRWRRGDQTVEPPDPQEIGEHLEAAIDLLRGDGTCLDCGAPLQAVRPGKHQCAYCDNIRHLERERDEARAQEDIHFETSRKLADLAERMLAEMEYVQWLSTAAVFRDELEQIKSS